MDKNLAVMVVLITAWIITACSYSIPNPYEYDFIIESDTSVGVQGTGSMLPTITSTSTLYLNNVKIMDDVKINDIIYFTNPQNNMNIIHRCIYKLENGCVTKGDNNPIADSDIINIKYIKYKVVAIKYE